VNSTTDSTLADPQRIIADLQRANAEGVRGGCRLARPADKVSFLDIVDAIEGEKPLFDCQEVREHCAVYGDSAPGWATAGTCAIHALMLQAEKAMRQALAAPTLGTWLLSSAARRPKSFLSMSKTGSTGAPRGSANERTTRLTERDGPVVRWPVSAERRKRGRISHEDRCDRRHRPDRLEDRPHSAARGP
jgi:DNA-binding IscR family transcriptional regulator